ncbi:PorT family protein [Spirosoma flavum]|uniref:PorT family protein n=1 Tax=Spirosoma flavum TaxID=2048557 RepID=A0ABW6ALT0_9BACT
MNTNLRLLLALLWFPTALLFGQQKLSILATVTPTLSDTHYTTRFLYPDSDGQIVEPVYLNGNRWASGYSAGLSLWYTYAPGWSVSSGIWYQQLTTRQARQAVAGEGTITLRKRVIRIPVLLNYVLSTKRLSPYFSFGVLTDIPIAARVIVTRSGQSTQYLRLENSSRPIFHVLVGAGMQYKLNRRYTLMAQPIWTYNLGQLGGTSTYNPSYELSLLAQIAYSF